MYAEDEDLFDIGRAAGTGDYHELAAAVGIGRARRRDIFVEDFESMAEGTIKRLTDKGFGFIDTGTGQDMFFHSSSLDGVSYDELREGQRVTYTEGRGPKGPRAEDVKLA